MDSQPPYVHAEFGTKLGHFQPGLGQVPYRHPHFWKKQPAGNQQRIVAGPRDGFIDLTLQLATCLNPPYSVLYVLAVPRSQEAGRYQLDGELSPRELKTLLDSYRDFLEGDARHHIWIYSRDSSATIVYDKHDLIYAYGPLDCYVNVLDKAGLSEGEFELPYPHMHNYFPEFDSEEERIINSHTWKRTGILPGVDD